MLKMFEERRPTCTEPCADPQFAEEISALFDGLPDNTQLSQMQVSLRFNYFERGNPNVMPFRNNGLTDAERKELLQLLAGQSLGTAEE